MMIDVVNADLETLFTLQLDAVIRHECMLADIKWGDPDLVTDYQVAEALKIVELGKANFMSRADRFTEICGHFEYSFWSDLLLSDTVPRDIFSYVSSQGIDVQIPFISKFYDQEVAQIWLQTENMENFNLEPYKKKHKIYVHKKLGVFWE